MSILKLRMLQTATISSVVFVAAFTISTLVVFADEPDAPRHTVCEMSIENLTELE